MSAEPDRIRQSLRLRSGPGATVLLVSVFLLAVTPLAALPAQPIAAQSPWPTYRGNLQRTGHSPYAGPKTGRVKWTFSTGGAGKNGGIETDPIIGPEGTVYIGANNGIFYALDSGTGAIRWVFPTGFDTYGIYSSPFVDRNGIVYFGAKDGRVYALKAPRRGILGQIVWSLNLGTTIETSPAFTPDGTLVIGADDWAYYGIAPPEGGAPARVRWRFQTGGTLISSPAVGADGVVYGASMDGKVYALAPPRSARGPVKVLWSFATGARDDKGGFENTPVLDGRGTLYIGANNGIFYALDARSGKLKWSYDGVARSGYRTYAIFSSAAVGPDGTVYFGGKNGILYAIREHRGFFSSGPEVLWRYKVGAGIQSSPLLDGKGDVYIGDERGTLHAVRPPQGGAWAETWWEFPTRGTLISSPGISPNGTLFVGSQDGRLYALGGGGRTASSAAGPLPGTWYGTFESGPHSGRIRVVLAPQEDKLWAAWYLDGLGRGQGPIRVKGSRLTISLPLRGARCRGTLNGEGTLQGGEIRGEIRLDRCAGKVIAGKLTLRRRP